MSILRGAWFWLGVAAALGACDETVLQPSTSELTATPAALDFGARVPGVAAGLEVELAAQGTGVVRVAAVETSHPELTLAYDRHAVAELLPGTPARLEVRWLP